MQLLWKVEDTLIQAFSQNRFADVDGNDVGQGVFNIFIIPKGPWGPVLERIYAFLKLRGVLERSVIAKLHSSGRDEVIWSKDYAGTFKL